MNATQNVLEARGVGKRFGLKWALRDCTVSIPVGKVAALVGPNGAGKSTLLRLAAGLGRPNEGSLTVLGEDPGDENASLRSKIGYLDQERLLYPSFRVAEMLRFGAATNATWDEQMATSYVTQLGIDVDARVHSLSSGQKAQIALMLCLAKRPELLILDEPAAALDPLAREDLLQLLMQQVAQNGSSVVLSTHAIGDIVSVCEYLVILSRARVVLCDDLDYVLSSHRILSAATSTKSSEPPGVTVIESRVSSREVSYLVRMDAPFSDAGWRITEPTLEEIVLAYLRGGAGRPDLNDAAESAGGDGGSQ